MPERLLFYIDEGETVYRVKRLISPDGLADVEYLGSLEEFIERLKKLITEGLVDEVAVHVKKGYEDEALKTLMARD